MFKKRGMSVVLLAIIVLQNMMPILDAASIESKQLTNTEDKQATSVDTKQGSKTLTACGADEVTGGTYTSLDDIVCIPDPTIKKSLNYSTSGIHDADADISVRRMQSISAVKLYDLSGNHVVESLQGMEYATNLESLDLGKTGGDSLAANLDYSYIEDLPLTKLILTHTGGLNQEAINVIQQISTLEVLGLTLNDLSELDLSPLSNLTNLITLGLDNTGISDISFTSTMTNLTTERLDNNKIRDFSPMGSYYKKLITFTADNQTWGPVKMIAGSDADGHPTVFSLAPGELTAPDGTILSAPGLEIIKVPWAVCVSAPLTAYHNTVAYSSGVAAGTISGLAEFRDCNFPLKLNATATIDEENAQSKEDLIDLFNVELTNSSWDALDPNNLWAERTVLTIDDSDVDYSTPGTYDVIVTYDYRNADGVPITNQSPDYYTNIQEKTVSLTVGNVTPELKTDTDSHTTTKKLTDEELIDTFGAAITPVDLDGDASGDLVISVDQSDVDYSTPGTYPVTFSFVDDDADHTEYTHEVNLIVKGEQPFDSVKKEVVDEGKDESGSSLELDGLAEADEVLKYTVTLDNGSFEQNNVKISDLIADPNVTNPRNLKISSSLGTDYSTVTDSDLTDGLSLSFVKIPAEDVVTITYEVTVKDAISKVAASIDNHVDVTGDDFSIIPPTYSLDASIPFAKDLPSMNDVVVNDKVVGTSVNSDNIADQTDVISYETTLYNQGKMSQENLKLENGLDAIDVSGNMYDVTITSDNGTEDPTDDYPLTSADYTIDENTINFTKDLKPKETLTVDYKVNTIDHWTDNTTVTNSATLTSSDIVNIDASSVLSNEIPKGVDKDLVIVTDEDSKTKEEESYTYVDDDTLKADVLNYYGVVVTDSVSGVVTDLSKITIDNIDTINVDHPGEYTLTIKYTDTIAGLVSKDITLTVDNITPTITTDSDSVNVVLGDDKLDYTTVFNPTITGEKVLNDNTIAVDDSCSYDSDTYNKAGACTIEYAINDDDSASTKITKTVTVNVIDPKDVITIGSDSETKEEEITALTDSELIDLFKVSAKDSVLGTDLSITVDATAVDYDHPGDYKITFSAEDSVAGVVSKDVTLTLSDIKPSIETDSDSIDVILGSDKLDYPTVFNPTITGEKVLNDNTIAVDDSCSYDSDAYDKVGACTIEYAINDDDSASTKITKTVTVNVIDPKDVITIGSDSETKEEEITALTDSELIDLFKVSAKDSVLGTDLPISVDSSIVDYDHPGDYKITFSAEDSVAGVVSKDVTLTLSDIKPSIETDSDSIDVILGSDKLDYTTVFNPTITGEKVLNDTLTVNDSCSYDSDTYNKAGACTIEYAINDDDSASTKITKTVTVNVIDPSDLLVIGNDSTTKEEEITALTDSELIDLFNVSSKDSVLGTDLPISVDSSSVDYDHPGDYKVTFTVEDSFAGVVSKDVTLTLSDIKPSIETDSDSIDVLLGTDKLDYPTVFNPTITGEKVLNDNTITVNDSCVDDSATYDKAGVCTIEYAINDDDSANTKITKAVTVNVIDPSDLLVIGNDSATKEEEIKPLTDSELIDLFQVSPIDSELGTDLDISVDSTAVDYDHPGDYKVTFTIDNPLGGVISKDVTLTLSDIKPTISTKVDSAEVSVGDDKLDYASVFNPSITGETVLNDDTITVDDTKVDYSKAGEYAITYSVSDDDAKESVITKDEKVIVNPKQVTPQSKVDKIKMTLATTGLGQTMMMLIIAAIVLIILTVLRYRNRRV